MALQPLEFLLDVLELHSTLVLHLRDGLLVLQQLGIRALHEFLSVPLEVLKAAARGVNGQAERRFDRRHGLAQVSVGRGDVAADVHHL